MATHIRLAASCDAAGIAAVVDAAYRHYVDRIGRAPGPMLDDYARIVREHDVSVAEHGGRIAGVLVLIDRDGRLLLDNIAVHPEVQGERLGVALLALAEARARERGFDALHLYTHALMHENIGWYRRMGYEETARVQEQGFDRVCMRKPLPAGNG